MQNKNAVLIIAIVIVILLCCCLATLVGGAATFIISSSDFITLNEQPTPTRVRTPIPTATRAATASPGSQATPVPTSDLIETEAQLKTVIVPGADPRDLTRRYHPEKGEIPEVVNATTPDYKVGDVETFWVSNTDTDENFQVEARLRVKSDHLYMWVENDAEVSNAALRASARLFDEQIYPTNRAFFGTEWSPGIDNDPRLHVLHVAGLGSTVAGYFSSADEIPSDINQFSNEKEMFYINLDNNAPGTDFYNSTLAHEFQHMIHWNEDRNESTWLNEGASELAMQLNGLFRSDESYLPDQAFADQPDLQLNTWPDSEESYAHYGSSFLFLNYFLSRFGEEMTQALVANSENSIESVDAVLQEQSAGVTADDLFADWVIANWLDDPEQGDGRWGYPDYDTAPMATSAEYRGLPASGEDDVSQYAADYITFPADGAVTIEFAGDPTVRLAQTDASSGQYAWWSHRVDESDTRLTLPVDLTGVDSATLHYKTWYDLEESWDYAYVAVSTDDGATWTALETERTTTENPQGNAYAPGYTGSSDGWVDETVDLTPYAGQDVLIRFEYVTDAAVTQPGMFIDDIEIPEIGFADDVESGEGSWNSEGWIRTNNRLKQRWIVQVIETKDNGEVVVHRLPVDAEGSGSLTLQDVSDANDLVLVVSALAPVTVERAAYQYEITPGP